MSTESLSGIYDTSAGRCTEALNIKGEHFQCDLAAEHDGWAHQSMAAEAIWSPVPAAVAS
jgi:hypothetical protein